MLEDFSKLNEKQLIDVLQASPIATPVSARAGGETNRLTTRILWLTIVGVILAAVGLGIAVVQLVKK